MKLTPEQRKNCVKLAAYIEQQPEDMFSMKDWGAPWCGTAGCIAGHAGALWRDCRYGVGYIAVVDTDKAAAKLGDRDTIFNELFIPDFMNKNKITTRMAAATLRRLAWTGEVKFDLADDL